MAKILYGLSGQGSGHSSRAKEVIDHLQKQGHDLTIVSYKQGYENLSRFFEVKKIAGLILDYKNNRVQILPTIYRNALKLPKIKKSLKELNSLVKEKKFDLVITDFEPLTCLMANIHLLPLISIDNQHELTKTKVEYPLKYEKDATLTKAVTRLTVFKADAYLVTSFIQAKPDNKKTFVFPPILRKKIIQAKNKTKEKDHILVYVTSASHNLEKQLKGLDQKFICYGFGKKGKEKNLEFKEPSAIGFLQDLLNCQGVLANAGFTLISEALYLGKPYLAWPVRAQFEQIFNAYNLDKLGYGLYAKEIDKKTLKKFIKNIPKYKRKLKKYKKQDNQKLFEKIDELIEKYSSKK